MSRRISRRRSRTALRQPARSSRSGLHFRQSAASRSRRSLSLESLEERTLLATVTVNSTTDVADGDASSIANLIATPGADTVISLREAITAANNDGGVTDTIQFNIPGAGVQTIQPNSALPPIDDPLLIDGYTQPGATPNTNPIEQGSNATLLIQLDGTNAGATAIGLEINAGSSRVQGLIINRFGDHGIELLANDGNVIAGNFIGTDASGTAALGNGSSGIFILNSAFNTIGGSAAGDRNVLSAQSSSGVTLIGNESAGNLIQGNVIGMAADGVSPMGNGDGVFISEAVNNVIGGTAPGEGNTIAFNSGDGVQVGAGIGNSILSNSIFLNGRLGIELEGDTATPNDLDDSDEGANRLQNFPEFCCSVILQDDMLHIEYLVPTNPANAGYPLRVEFFLADSDNQEGKTFLGFDDYTLADFAVGKKVVTIPAGPAQAGGVMVATATDTIIQINGELGAQLNHVDHGNTSEFSAPVAITAPDAFEPNDTIETATILGSLPKITLRDLSIHAETDVDFFKVTAQDTGKLIINALFDHGLGNLGMSIRDMHGNVIASAISASDNEQIIIPVVTQEMYFIEVFGFGNANPEVCNTNNYALEIENFPVPVPSGIHMDPASDTGMMHDDLVTMDTTPRFFVQADLTDFNDMGIAILSPFDAQSMSVPGAAVQVFLVNSFDGSEVVGYASQVGSSTTLFQFTPNRPLADGVYFVSAAVQIIDGQRDADAEPAAAKGRSQLSEPLWVTIDTTAPKGVVLQQFAAELSGDQEVAPVETRAGGRAALTLSPNGERLEMTIELSGLDLDGNQTPENPNDNVTGLHIHNGSVGVNGPIVFGLIGPNNDQSGDLVIDAAAGRITSAWDLDEGNNTSLDGQLANLLNGDLYFNVHTTVQTGGEIRGQILAANGMLDMLQSSDSGMSLFDDVTSKMSPAFTGRAEANAKVRVFATNEQTGTRNLIGQGVVGTDLTDGVLSGGFDNHVLNGVAGGGGGVLGPPSGFRDNGLGLWEVTVEPLVDGHYQITAEFEDLAGNIGSAYLFQANGTLPAEIPDDGAPHDFTFDVAHLAGSIVDVDVSLDILHPRTDELSIFLVSPAGSEIALVIEEGTGANFIGTTFDHGAPNSITTGNNPFTGRFHPEGNLFELDGEDPNGPWSLRITDNSIENAGLLIGWSLCIKTDAGLPVWIDSIEPNTPFLDLVEADDSGRHNDDNVTNDNTPRVTMTSHDEGFPFPDPAFEDNFKFRIWDRFEGDPDQAEYLLYDSTKDLAVTAVSDPADVFTSLTLILETLPEQYFSLFGTNNAVVNQSGTGVLADGIHNLKLEVEDRAGNISHDFLLDLLIDTAPPPKSFGDPANPHDGLHPDSDSGVIGQPNLFVDRITNDTRPTFFGRAEADALVRAFVVTDDGGTPLDPTDDTLVPLGQTVAIPLDGDDAFPGGEWEITSAIELNDPALGLDFDGLRTIRLTAEDLAGNLSRQMQLEIFIDTQGPRILSVTYENGRSVFDPKPTNGPTPLADSLRVTFYDQTLREGEGVFGAALTGGQEVPPVATQASGFADLFFNQQTGLFDLDLFVLGIGLADLTGAHIHVEEVGVNGPVIFDLDHTQFVADGAGIRRTISGAAFPAANIADLLAGNTYINVHTTANPGGEIRGQLLAGFNYAAVNEALALNPRSYQVVGDHNGHILIDSVTFVAAGTGGIPAGLAGGGATGSGSGSGAVVIDGGDRWDHGEFNGANNIEGWRYIEQIVDFALNGALNGAPNDILALNATQEPVDAITSVANELGASLDFVGGANISTVDFTQWKVLYVTGSEDDGGATDGISDADLALLATRTADIQNFVNSGGSLVALTEDGAANPYAWLELPDPFVIAEPIDQEADLFKTPQAIAAGITINDAELSEGDPYHTQYLGPPGFNGLQPWAINTNDEIITLGLPSNSAGIGLVPGVTYTVQINFAEPLPDDRFTLTVFDRISDDAGNALDGDSRPEEPGIASQLLPSGDAVPGETFEARFTVDSRPELGVWAGGSVYVDNNGNFVWDPENKDNDDTNEDIAYVLGFTTDDIFAGNFSPNVNSVADGFDKLAAYGRVGGQFRWLIDTDNDGVPNIMQLDPANVNGLPVAGNFDNNAANGDEVGVFDGRNWFLDTNHDYQVDTQISGNLRGYPIVGDFDGDGTDDLATWEDDQFFIDLNLNGNSDAQFQFGFTGIREKPVAADMNQDGFDDIGLWVPDRGGPTPREIADWYFLVSDGESRVNGNGEGTNGPSFSQFGGSVLDRITTDLEGNQVIHFTPEPFGGDLFAQFGDEFGLPVVGNFDPPVTSIVPDPPAGTMYQNSRNPMDVNLDGIVSPLDALNVINDLNLNGSRALTAGFASAPGYYIDVNGDSAASPLDALWVINYLNEHSTAATAVASYSQVLAPASAPAPAPASSDASQPVTASADAVAASVHAADSEFIGWDAPQRAGSGGPVASPRASRVVVQAQPVGPLQVVAADRAAQRERHTGDAYRSDLSRWDRMSAEVDALVELLAEDIEAAWRDAD